MPEEPAEDLRAGTGRHRCVVIDEQRGNHNGATVTVVDHTELGDETRSVATTPYMHDCVDRRDELAVQRIATETADGTERFESRRHVGRFVGVNRAAPTLMAGVERGEQVDHFTASHLTDDEPVGSHAQRLPDEVADGDRARAFDVGRSRFESYDVGMLGSQLRGILDEEHAMPRLGKPEQGREQCRLARPGTAGDDERQPPADECAQGCGHRWNECARSDEVLEGERSARRYADRDAHPIRRNGREHCVQPAAVRQPRVDVRLGRVQTSTSAGREPSRKSLGSVVTGKAHRRGLEPVAAVDPHAGAVDENVGHVGIGEQRRERTGAAELVTECGDDVEHLDVAAYADLGAQRDGDPVRRRWLTRCGEPLPDAVDELGIRRGHPRHATSR